MRANILPLAATAAGKFDWARENVGSVGAAVFRSVGSQRLAVVASEAAVAGIDLRTGGTAWRRVLPEGESVGGLLALGSSGVLSTGVAHRDGRAHGSVRLFSDSGALLWDAVLDAVGDAAAPPVTAATDVAIYAASATSVLALHAATGKELWRWTAPADKAGLRVAALVPQGGEVRAYGVLDGRLAVATLGASDGAPASKGVELIKGEALLGGAPLVAVPDGSRLVSLSADKAKLVVHAVGSGKAEAHPLAALLPAGAAAEALSPTPLPGGALLSLAGGGSAVVALGKGSAPARLAKHVAPAAAGGAQALAAAEWKEGGALLALARAEAGALTLQTCELAADGAACEWSAAEPLGEADGELGAGFAAWVGPYARKDGSTGARLLVRSAGDALALHVRAAAAAAEGGKGEGGRLWVREEALASVSGAELLPLPAIAIDRGAAEQRPFFGFALPAVADGIKSRLEALQRSAAEAEAEAKRLLLLGDAYGSRQVVVAATAASKLFGLHSSTGAVLWSRHVPPLAPGAPPPLLRGPFVSGSGATALVHVVATDGGRWAVLTVGPFDGSLVGERREEGELVHAAQLPGSAAGTLLLVDASLGATTHPATPAAGAELASRLSTTFFHLVSPSQVQGFGLVAAAGGGVRASARWSVALPPAASSRTAYFSHRAAVHSAVRTKGDRSVLHKYINRNVLAVGSEVKPAGGEAPYVQLLLLDSVSGRRLHSARHSNCAGPLSLLLGENTLLYSYRAEGRDGPQTTLTAAELYVNSSVASGVLSLLAMGPLDPSLRKNQFDAFAAPPPLVLSQSYAFPTSIAAMGLTLTQKGITPKQMSAADKEEGLVPYSPSLGGINALQVVSHRHTVARPRAIVAAPTVLESTSLVFSYGLDLFLTRAAPARTFDQPPPRVTRRPPPFPPPRQLNEDFNKLGLLGACLGMLVATVATSMYSARRDLNAAWA
ncbi:hypothetical protein EMIHUDRAFT_470207 [Emiliania huxleyi CCMP1516]|uniref:ER membrane protein complex subunit 1 n=2 Tax=Emiliania huxleyi TaxID=2903 RepID=A0A0D3J598_EMIH1|nr:hypothetical protein EMIHUDRAFT_470207 [Emiliania huxleyi CCMP1516]EOD18683.1 hypothetical protein EMIHUDRAFT_470207 [Emiliania huxleyi CCMP1516]|eukprot:XP_005771112.1 hypothetical protein EMIHUDRAFT_470207 [Emiliania huxleyi CCMP1516]